MDIKDLEKKIKCLDEDDPESAEYKQLYDFLISAYETKSHSKEKHLEKLRKLKRSNQPIKIIKKQNKKICEKKYFVKIDFNDIVIMAYERMQKHIQEWEESVDDGIRLSKIGELLGEDYSVSVFNFLRIIIFKFIMGMYFKYQDVQTLYQRTRQEVEKQYPNVKHISLLTSDQQSPVKNYYNRLKKEYDSSMKDFYFTEKFDTINVNARERKHGVSKEISELKAVYTTDKVLLNHEYEMFSLELYSKGAYRELELFTKKVKNSSIKDKKNYSNKSIIKAFHELEDLYRKIISLDVSIIDRCIILYEIECEYRLEMYYKWLREFKRCDIEVNDEIMKFLAMLYQFQVFFEFVSTKCPNYRSKIIWQFDQSEAFANDVNSIFLYADGAIENAASTTDIDKYVNRIIILNFIAEEVLGELESEFSGKMKHFDFYRCSELNDFLENFIGKGQYIVYNKNLKEEIDMDTLRNLYYKIIKG